VERSGLLKATVKVEVRDKRGKLIGIREKEADLILDNFRDLLAEVLYPRGVIAAGSARYAALVDAAGTARSVAVFSALYIASGEALNFVGVNNADIALGSIIQIGTSTVAPTRGDYKIVASVKYGTPTQTVGADYISWAVSLVLDAAADIAEAGMFLECIVDGFGAAPVKKWVMMFRDTFTPISVPAGGTISITYTLTL